MAQNKHKSLPFFSDAEADDFNFISLLNTIFQFLCHLLDQWFLKWSTPKVQLDHPKGR